MKRLNKKNFYDGAVISVSHDEFKKIGSRKIKQNVKNQGFIFDLKSTFPKNQTDWQL